MTPAEIARLPKIIIGTIDSAAKSSAIKSAQKQDSFTPKNLLHFLKKKLRSYDEIVKFLKNLPPEERYVGALPEKWLQLFDRKNIGKKTKEIQKIFSDFARGDYSPYAFKPEISVEKLGKLSKDLEKALGKPCSVSYTGCGLSGKVYRINCAGEDLALKTYYSDTKNFLLKSTGKTKEVATAVALNYTLKPNQRARFYLGKLAIGSEADGFMLTEFVKPNRWRTECGNIFLNLYKRFTCRDAHTPGNIISGKMVDFGYVENAFENFRQQQMAKKLCSLIKKGDIRGINKMKRQYRNNLYFEDLLSLYKREISQIKKQ